MMALIIDQQDTEDKGGQFQPGRYFSGKTASPFFGLSHAVNSNLLFKLEYDITQTPGLVGYELPKKTSPMALNILLEITLQSVFQVREVTIHH